MNNTTTRPNTVGARARAAKETSGGNEAECQYQRLHTLATLGAVSASTAHEIKNALVPVRTFVDLLLEEHPGSELGVIVRREIERINQLAAEMLKLATPPAPQLVPLSLHNVIAESLCLVHHQANLKGVHLNCDLEAVPDRMLGDANRLKQVFLNLLLNALDAVSQGGEVVVRTRMLPGENQIEAVVSDNGCGIAQCDMPHLFQPFYTTKEGGTGLGLAIVQEIVAGHHGSIQGENRVEHGASFRMRFPIAGLTA